MPLLFLLFVLLAPALAPAADEPHAVIFMYHRFGEDEYPTTSIRLAQFDAQLEYLAANGYQVWPLERIVDHLQRGETMPERTVAITVDDAYLSVYREAYPRLKARGWPFTVFANTDPIDQHLAGYMTWDEMRQMQANGVRFANHGATHDSLVERRSGEEDAAWEGRLRADIEQGQRRLQAELGPKVNSDPRLFAYPYGEFDTRAGALIRRLGFIGFGQQSGAVGPYADLRALPRYPMAEHFAALEEFARKAASLPLPVSAAEPWDPRVGGENPPHLTLTLARPIDGLTCYNAAGHPLPIGVGKGEEKLTVTATAPLAIGRDRYNCTAPAGNGRWYWYSHPWLVKKTAGPADRSDPVR